MVSGANEVLHLMAHPGVLTCSKDVDIARRSICNLQKRGIIYLRQDCIAKTLTL